MIDSSPPPSQVSPTPHVLATSRVQTLLPDSIGARRRPLLTPLADPGHFLLVLDNSSLDGWKRCAMYARNYLVMERQAHPHNAALAFGGAIHAGLDTWLQGKRGVQFGEFPVIETESDDDFLRRICAVVVSYFADHATPPDDYRTPANAVAVIGEYIKRSKMPDYQMEIMRDDEGLMVERAFEIPLGVLEVNDWIQMAWLDQETFVRLAMAGDPAPLGSSLFVSHIHIAWSGRIDLVAQPSGRKPHIYDHKTGMIDTKQYVLASQSIGYVFAAQTLWPKMDIDGFCLDGIALKRPAKGCSITDRGPRGGDPALQLFRGYYTYSPERIAQWKADTLAHIGNFIHCLVTGHFPLNDSSCIHKYGVCPYFDACSIDNATVRDRVLASPMYADVTWNPVR